MATGDKTIIASEAYVTAGLATKEPADATILKDADIGVTVAGKSATDTLLDSKIGSNLSVAINTARATVASHATTADIWGALGNQIDWTGTTTTTAFPTAPQAGAERTLICAGACSFTAGANMLIDGVLSGATVTCAAGDTVIVRAVSTAQFKLTRLKADGTAQVAGASGGWTVISTANINNTAIHEFTSITGYDEYKVIINSVNTTAASLRLYLGVGGVTKDVDFTILYNSSSSASQAESGLGYSQLAPSAYVGITYPLYLELDIHNFTSATVKTTFDSRRTSRVDGGTFHQSFVGSGNVVSAESDDYIQVQFGNTTFTGSIVLLGANNG